MNKNNSNKKDFRILALATFKDLAFGVFLILLVLTTIILLFQKPY